LVGTPDEPQVLHRDGPRSIVTNRSEEIPNNRFFPNRQEKDKKIKFEFEKKK